MPQLAIAILVAVIVLVIFGRLASKRGREMREQQKREFATGEKQAPAADTVVDVEGLRPTVAEFHVHETDATVTFDVPLPEGDIDEVLVDILVDEAVEVTREKSHTLPIDQVTRVVAMAGGRRVGVRELEEAGLLPRSIGTSHLPQLHAIGKDPVEYHFSVRPGDDEETVASTGGDRLRAIGSELRIPKAIEVGLRSQGVDPATMSAGDMVRTVLNLFGYTIESGDRPHASMATKAGETTYLFEVAHGEGDHPELDERSIDEFMFAFSGSGADRGLLVTEKFAPFAVYDRERRQPKVRFVSRERLQKFIDGAALG